MYYGENFRKGFSKYQVNTHNRSNKLLLLKDKRKGKAESPVVQACLKKVEVGSEGRKRLLLEDELVQGNMMKVHSDIKSLNEYRKKGLVEPARKVKIRIPGEILKEDSRFTEELQRLHHLQTTELERSL